MTLSLVKFPSLFIGKNFMKKILLLNLLFVGILYSQDSELENVEEVVVVGTKASLISAKIGRASCRERV